MVRLSILDDAGNTVTPQEITTAAELTRVTDQARTIIRECEHVADTLRREHGKNAPRQVPYSA